MNPNNPETLDIVFDSSKNDREKMDSLVDIVYGREHPEGYLRRLVDEVVALSEFAAEPDIKADLGAGQGVRTEASSAEIGEAPKTKSKGPNYLAPKIDVPGKDGRVLGLELFAFNPRRNSPYRPAVTAKWYEPGQNIPIFTERIDQRMFSGNYVGRDPRAGAILGIVAVSVAVYKETLAAVSEPGSL